MTITEKTKMSSIGEISHLLKLSETDIIKECSKFDPPKKLNKVSIMPFDDLSFWGLTTLWNEKNPGETIYKIIELFIFSQLDEKKKKKIGDIREWSDNFVKECGVIDFYSFLNDVTKNVKKSSELFSSIKVELSDEEKQSGYGSTDALATQKTILAFMKELRISSFKEAESRSWGEYYLLFKSQADESNRQRKYNKIINEKSIRK